MKTCTQRGPHARDEKQKDKTTRLIKYKRKRKQENKIRHLTTKKEKTMTIAKTDTEAENRRTREQIIKERIQENKGTRGKIIKSSVGRFGPRTFPLRDQDNKINLKAAPYAADPL